MKAKLKYLLPLVALFLILGCLPAPTASATPDTITVHAYVPTEWLSPCVYSWPTNGEGSIAWPGTDMTQESGQWYVATIPASDNNLIINYYGYPQTFDLSFDGGYEELWVVVEDYYGDYATIYYSADDVQLPDGDTTFPEDSEYKINPADPEGLFEIPYSLAIVGTGIPGVSEWNPADSAGDMTEVSYLRYEIDIPCPAGTSMKFKFAGNDMWTDTCNLGSASGSFGEALPLVNSGGSADIYLSVIEAVVLRFSVDLRPLATGTGAATLTVTEVGPLEDTPVTPPVENTVTVHARIPESWGDAPCLWAWKSSDNTNAFDAWPGEIMRQNGEWFEYEIPVWCDSVIVYDGDAIQTYDLTVEAGREVWLDIYAPDNVDITYYAPGPRVEPVTYITIHTRIPKDWNTPPYLWAWRASDHENAFDAWPGEMMYKWGEWYELEIPTWCDSIVINDGGSTLTVDLNIEPGVELWVDVYTPDIVNIYPYEPGPRTEDSDPEPTTPESTAPTETSPAETRPTETNPTETDSQPTTPPKNDDDTPASAFFPDTLISVLILCAIVFGILGTGTAAYLILRKK